MVNPNLIRELHLQLEQLTFSEQEKVLKFAKDLADGTLSEEEAREKIDALKKQKRNLKDYEKST